MYAKICISEIIWRDAVSCTVYINFLDIVVQWIEPNGWDGPVPAFYRTFDTLDTVTLMEENHESSLNALVCGKVGSVASDSLVHLILSIILLDTSESTMIIILKSFQS